MPKPKRNPIWDYLLVDYDRIVVDPNQTWDIDEWQDDLIAAGLDPYEVTLLTMRYVERCTFKEIAEDMGWKSVSSAKRHHDTALLKLREGGYGKR